MKQRVTPWNGRHILLQIPFGRVPGRFTMDWQMKLRLLVLGLVTAATALAAGGALAQPGQGRHGGGDRHMQRQMHRQMPPPERRMSWEERQRLREQVRSGQMTREEARARWHEQRMADPSRFSPEQREQLRRDVNDANRDLERR